MKVRWHWGCLAVLLLMVPTTVPENAISEINELNLHPESTKNPLDIRENVPFRDSEPDDVSKASVINQKESKKVKKIVPKGVKQPKNDEKPKRKKSKKTKKQTEESESEHSRQKRMIWITDDGRLALPPGTVLMITPSLGLPFVRYPPDGFLANISVSLPVTIEFDKLGLTDNANPLGVLPPVLARSMGKAAGSMLANYIGKFIRSRHKRSSDESFSRENFKFTKTRLDDELDNDEIPLLPDEHKHAFHGGERALLYAILEDFIATFGVDGKACVLRTICEVHSKSIHHFGLVGEMVKLFLTASLSPFSDLLNEYVVAEKVGKGQKGPGECFPYFKNCPRSIFKSNEVHKKYEKEQQESFQSEVDLENEINTSNQSM